MTPTPPDANSPLATLRQLKEMLDAGSITPQEFEALKQRLIFGPEVPTPSGPAEPTPAAPPAETPPAPNPVYLDTPAALTPEATPLLTPEPDWLAAPAPALLTPSPTDEPAETAAERRNPLNLIFALGGLLLFLGVVAYLLYDRRPDEHVTSQSQTAADSVTVAPEVGPQAEQLTLPPAAAPETIRVAPAAPPPTVADNTPAGIDSTAALPENLPPPKSQSAPPRPTIKPAPTAVPAPADSAARP